MVSCVGYFLYWENFSASAFDLFQGKSTLSVCRNWVLLIRGIFFEPRGGGVFIYSYQYSCEAYMY